MARGADQVQCRPAARPLNHPSKIQGIARIWKLIWGRRLDSADRCFVSVFRFNRQVESFHVIYNVCKSCASMPSIQLYAFFTWILDEMDSSLPVGCAFMRGLERENSATAEHSSFKLHDRLLGLKKGPAGSAARFAGQVDPTQLRTMRFLTASDGF